MVGALKGCGKWWRPLERWHHSFEEDREEAAFIGEDGKVGGRCRRPWRGCVKWWRPLDGGGNSFGEEGNFEMVRISYCSDTM